MGQPQPALSEDELYYTDMPVGEILRRTRQHYGQSLDDIERALRIRASLIDAIETGHAERLPGRVYAIGFVRTYSEYLGLDGNKMVHLFKIQDGTKASSPELHFPAAASESKVPPVWIVAVSLAVAVMLASGFFFSRHAERAVVTEVPEVPAAMKAGPDMQIPSEVTAEAVTTETATTVPAEAAPEATPAAGATDTPSATTPTPTPAGAPAETAPAPQGIILNIVQNSWVEIRDKSGKAIVSRVLKAGDQYYVPDRPDLTISMGNAAGVALEVDGIALKPLGKPGEVKKAIPLDSAFLKKTYAKTIEKTPE